MQLSLYREDSAQDKRPLTSENAGYSLYIHTYLIGVFVLQVPAADGALA